MCLSAQGLWGPSGGPRSLERPAHSFLGLVIRYQPSPPGSLLGLCQVRTTWGRGAQGKPPPEPVGSWVTVTSLCLPPPGKAVPLSRDLGVDEAGRWVGRKQVSDGRTFHPSRGVPRSDLGCQFHLATPFPSFDPRSHTLVPPQVGTPRDSPPFRGLAVRVCV